MRASFTKLPNGDWGVRVQNEIATGFEGKTVVVTKRDGTTRDITLAQMLQAWEGGSMASYTIAPRNGNGNGSSAAFSVPNQPLDQRSKKTYRVEILVKSGDGKTVIKRWTQTIKAQDENLPRETGVDVVKTAIAFYNVLDKSGDVK